MKNLKIDWDLFYDLYADDPISFFDDILNFHCDPWQIEATKGFIDSQMISIPSGQGVGKTAWVACLVIWYITFHAMCRIVATAPTMQQLNDVLWPEIAKWLRPTILKDIISWKKTKLEMAGYEEVWFATSRTSTRPENMQGYHADHMLFVIDESSGVADDIITAIYGTLGGADNRLIMIGNPTKNHGLFFDSFTVDRHNFFTLRVNAEDSPRTNKKTIQMLQDKYGYESNVYRVRVLGLPPTNEDDVFIPIELMESAVTSNAPTPVIGDVAIIDIGCDVARYGEDKTILAPRIDNEIQSLVKSNKRSTMETAENLVFLGNMLRQKYKYKSIVAFKIDDSGVGGGVTDRLIQKQKGNPELYNWYKVVPLQFGLTTKRFKYYDDTTTWMMSILKALIDPYDKDGNKKDFVLRLPNDSDLIGQGSSRKFYLTERSKLRVESKKDMKKRGVSSPDELDAVLLACVPFKRKF